jgi:hypothetical protein
MHLSLLTFAAPAIDFAALLRLRPDQRRHYAELLPRLRARLARPELVEAMSLLARVPFDRPALAFLIGAGPLIDELERFHDRLTPAQLARLRGATPA